MAYLTYIIENYATLPPITAFVHASPEQWHNDVFATTNETLSRLDLSTVRRRGYVNLRCALAPGCPVSVRPFDESYKQKENPVYSGFEGIYGELFNGSRVPEIIGGVCCAQFVVTRERIWDRPREEYVWMREWVVRSKLDSVGVGSVFEMLWHVVFREGPVL